MLRYAILALAASAFAVLQTAPAGAKIHGALQRGPDIVPWFLVDGATRLGVFPRWYVSDYYPYFIYRSVYPNYIDADFIVTCHQIRRPVLGVYGWHTRAVPACN
jgi:hypothetical protein